MSAFDALRSKVGDPRSSLDEISQALAAYQASPPRGGGLIGAETPQWSETPANPRWAPRLNTLEDLVFNRAPEQSALGQLRRELFQLLARWRQVHDIDAQAEGHVPFFLTEVFAAVELASTCQYDLFVPILNSAGPMGHVLNIMNGHQRVAYLECHSARRRGELFSTSWRYTHHFSEPQGQGQKILVVEDKLSSGGTANVFVPFLKERLNPKQLDLFVSDEAPVAISANRILSHFDRVLTLADLPMERFGENLQLFHEALTKVLAS